MVAINAGCYLFPSPIAIIVGAISAAIAIHTIPVYEKFGIDDPIAATSVHFLGGVWGHLSVGNVPVIYLKFQSYSRKSIFTLPIFSKFELWSQI